MPRGRPCLCLQARSRRRQQLGSNSNNNVPSSMSRQRIRRELGVCPLALQEPLRFLRARLLGDK